jgi:dihydroorotate dehydrogenase (fumarate)
LFNPTEVVAHLELSTSRELLLPLRWIALLYGRILAGARVALLASALVRHGPAHLTYLRAELVRWMEEHEYASLSQMRGSMSQQAVAEPAAFERAHYIRALNLFDLALPESWR